MIRGKGKSRTLDVSPRRSGIREVPRMVSEWIEKPKLMVNIKIYKDGDLHEGKERKRMCSTTQLDGR